MKALYFGGQKSGKSRAASAKALSISDSVPHYVATYDNSYSDGEMQQRIDKHLVERRAEFLTIEAPHCLKDVVKAGETYLVDCLSMWIFNNLQRGESALIDELKQLFEVDCNLVFVLNDVSCGIIPIDKESRRFVDLSGIIGQFVAAQCDEVYRVSFGIEERLK